MVLLQGQCHRWVELAAQATAGRDLPDLALVHPVLELQVHDLISRLLHKRQWVVHQADVLLEKRTLSHLRVLAQSLNTLVRPKGFEPLTF